MTGHATDPSRERFLQRLGEFNKAADRLDAALNQPETEFVRDSIVQRYEFTFELAWKTMQAWLRLSGTNTRSARDTLGEALRQGIIGDGEGWSRALECRNITSHLYDEGRSVEVSHFARGLGIALLRDALNCLTRKASEDDPLRAE
jgi:nucleotidyltransferase substrate binding protein (TIGR01987 family)